MKLKKSLLVSMAFLMAVGLDAKLMAGTTVQRVPKEHVCNVYTTAPKTIATGPGTLYSVTLTTGSAAEYVVAFDTGSTLGVGLSTTTGVTLMFPPLFYGGSANNVGAGGAVATSSNTIVTFDPPLLFYNGLVAFDQSATGMSCYSFDVGRIQ